MATSAPRQHLFDVNLPVEVAGFTIPLLKGWAAVDVEVNGRSYHFVTTHFEPANILPGNGVDETVHAIQRGQAAQLLDALDGVTAPVVLTGDLNSEPGGHIHRYPTA